MNARTFLPRLSRRMIVIIAAVLVVLSAAAVWVFVFLLPSQSSAAQTVTQTTPASLVTMQKSVTTTGTVTPAVQEDVSFAVSGTVTSIAVAEGDTVAADAPLATVDTLELQADLYDAQATLAEAKAALADAEDDDTGTESAAARVTAASAAVDVAQADVDAATAALDDATLVAPAAGLVTSVGIAVGDRVSGSSDASGSGSGTDSGSGAGSGDAAASATSASDAAAFTIVSTDAWTLDVSVGETDIANVAQGQQVELATSDGTEYFGIVSEVGTLPSTTDGSAQYPVAITVTGAGEGLYDGVSVDVTIVYERRTDVLAVPSAAVTTTEGESTVTLVDEDGGETVAVVEVGETSGQYTEILSGLAEGDEVLVAGFTPGEGNSGGTGDLRSGTDEMPGGGEMPSGGFPGGEQSTDGGQQ